MPPGTPFREERTGEVSDVRTRTGHQRGSEIKLCASFSTVSKNFAPDLDH